MFTLTSLNRFQAAGSHFALSVVVAATVLAALLLVWYPQPYFRLAGGADLMVILIGVDVVMGPLMTLVVFNPAKKSLRLDLAIIVALQLAAFAYGISVIAQARPVYVVYAGERFTVVGANMIDPESLASAPAPWNTLPVDGPRIVGAQMPAAAAEREKVMMLLTSGIDLPMLPRYYVPFADVVPQLKARAQPLEVLEKRKPDAKATLDAAIARSGAPRSSLAWVPVLGRLEIGTALVDVARGEVVAVVRLDPF
jgi:hypothetical protein